MTRIVLSGIQPSGELHLGNYFGAISNWVRLQNEGGNDCYYAIVDLHAMTSTYDPAMLRKFTQDMVIDLIACGLDPNKSTLFIQSLVPEHSELYWILGCFASYGDLTRQTQFKEKIAQSADKFISAGLFSYPVLQAADILAYRAHLVPVGKDQDQHLELTRDVAIRLNGFAGKEIFPQPATLGTPTRKIQSFADPAKKMSKSLGPKHYVGLFEDEASVRAKVKSAVTDSGDVTDGQMAPGLQNMLDILRACGRDDIATDFETRYAAGERKYAPFKAAVADVIVALTEGFRARRAELAHDPKALREQFMAGSEKARQRAAETLDIVKDICGVPRASTFARS